MRFSSNFTNLAAKLSKVKNKDRENAYIFAVAHVLP
jgi:hypothetical protein